MSHIGNNSKSGIMSRLETTVPRFVLLQEIINVPVIKAAGATAQ
jgi:hypothetical protein